MYDVRAVGIFSGKYLRSIFEHIKNSLRIAFISGQGPAAHASRPSLNVIQTSWISTFPEVTGVQLCSLSFQIQN